MAGYKTLSETFGSFGQMMDLSKGSFIELESMVRQPFKVVLRKIQLDSAKRYCDYNYMNQK